MDNPPQIEVKVWTPKEVLYQGEALALSSKNSAGKFDIIPFHANFITIIENETVEIVKPDKQKISFKFTQAIIYTSQNKVSVYAEPKTL